MNGETIQLFQRQIAENDEGRAYKTLYGGCFTPLLRFAVSIVKTKEAAEEIVADIFIKLWEQRNKLSAIQNLRVYLYVSVKNACLNYLSKKNKDIITYFDDYEVDTAIVETNPEELLITAEMKRKIEEAIDNLPPRCKMIFRLIREEGLRYKEVSEIMDISVNTIDVQMAIAVKRIAKAINLDFSSNKDHFSRTKPPGIQ